MSRSDDRLEELASELNRLESEYRRNPNEYNEKRVQRVKDAICEVVKNKYD